MNHHYANAVREGMIDLTLGRANKEVKIGDCRHAFEHFVRMQRRYARVGVARNRHEGMATKDLIGKFIA